MRAVLFIVTAIASLSFLFSEEVVAQVGYQYELPSIPTPGKRQPKAEKNAAGNPAQAASIEGTCDRRQLNSLICRYDIFLGKLARPFNLRSDPEQFFGTWTLKTLVTMSTDKPAKEVEVDPSEVPLRGLNISGISIRSISDTQYTGTNSSGKMPYDIREDGVTVDFYMVKRTDETQVEYQSAFQCRIVNFRGTQMVCKWFEFATPYIVKVGDNPTNQPKPEIVQKGFTTFTRKSPPRQLPPVANQRDYRNDGRGGPLYGGNPYYQGAPNGGGYYRQQPPPRQYQNRGNNNGGFFNWFF